MCICYMLLVYIYICVCSERCFISSVHACMPIVKSHVIRRAHALSIAMQHAYMHVCCCCDCFHMMLHIAGASITDFVLILNTDAAVEAFSGKGQVHCTIV
jgi:hypothetical protein